MKIWNGVGVTAPLIDLVAVSYNATGETRRFLESLNRVRVPFSLTVVDNASPLQEVRLTLTDEKLIDQILSKGYCLEYRVVENSTNVGYARAINQGVALGTAPVVAALNCDIEFLDPVGENDVVGLVLEHFREDALAGVVGPRTTDDGVGRDVISVPTVSGATYFVRRDVWQELTDCEIYQQSCINETGERAEGAFLPTKHFYEETFCSYHTRLHGWDVKYLGTAHMRHFWHRSSAHGSQDIQTPRVFFLKALADHGLVE